MEFKENLIERIKQELKLPLADMLLDYSLAVLLELIIEDMETDLDEAAEIAFSGQIDDDMQELLVVRLRQSSSFSNFFREVRTTSVSGRQLKVGQDCLAILTEDGEWHPAVIVHVEQDLVHVKFVEFLKLQILPADSIVVSDLEEDQIHANGDCQLCGRQTVMTRHHLIPRTTHARYLKRGFSRNMLSLTVELCRACHNAVHRAEDEATLAAKFRTLEDLRQHPYIQCWLSYAVKLRKGTRWDHALLSKTT